jgi:hypothetical protein
MDKCKQIFNTDYFNKKGCPCQDNLKFYFRNILFPTDFIRNRQLFSAFSSSTC